MKRLCFAIFFSPLYKGDILILGEYHFVQEMQDVECEIIQKYTNEYDSIIVFVEAPYFVNFYVNELF